MKKLVELHNFFVKESKTFIGDFTFSNKLYYPIAYIKFMWYSLS